MSPKTLTLSRASAWPAAAVESYLRGSVIPLRLSCNTARGFPLLNSLWYEYRDGHISCATHQSSAIVRHLAGDGRCAFEVATNDPPYFGVRGQGRAELTRDGAAQLLARLIDRYLGDSNPELAGWLLGRAAEEYLVRITPDWVTSWDYRPRMQPA